VGHLWGRGRSSSSTWVALLEPLAVGWADGQLALDLLVADDATLARGVDQEHAARLEAALAHHLLEGSTSSTPTSLAMITRSSSVTQ
jgi:hypothetical protein